MRSFPPHLSVPDLALADLPLPHPEHVEEFRGLYQKQFGKILTTEQATGQLIHLLAVVSFRRAGGRPQTSSPPNAQPGNAQPGKT